jgi:hypothetical protein
VLTAGLVTGVCGLLGVLVGRWLVLLFADVVTLAFLAAVPPKLYPVDSSVTAGLSLVSPLAIFRMVVSISYILIYLLLIILIIQLKNPTSLY